MNIHLIKQKILTLLSPLLSSNKNTPQTESQYQPEKGGTNSSISTQLTTDNKLNIDLHNIQPNAIKNTLQFNQQTYIQAPFFTQSEFTFYQKLKQIVSPTYDILFEVSLSAIIQLNPNLSFTDKQKFFFLKEYANKRVDFVLIDQTGKIFCVIELDDPSHDNDTAKKFDSIKDNVLHCANIPLIRIRDTKHLSPKQLFHKLFTQKQ